MHEYDTEHTYLNKVNLFLRYLRCAEKINTV